MLRNSWRGVVEHPVRFLMSLLAVVLGVAFVTGTFALRGVLADTFHDIVDSSMQGDVYVRGELINGDDPSGAAPLEGGSRNLIPMNLTDQIEAVDGVGLVMPEISGSVVVVGANGTAVTTSGAPSFAIGLDERDETVWIEDGAWPRGPSEIGIESSALKRSGLSVGDTTKVVIGGQALDVTVVTDIGFGAPVSGAVIVGLDMEVAKEFYAPDGNVETIAIFGDGSVSEEELAEAVRAVVGSESIDVITGSDIRAETREAIDQIVGFIGVFLLVFALIALFVGAFIIVNTFTMQVRQRLREIAVLRAVGASPLQVFSSVVGQAIIVGIVGSALGVLAGAGLIALITRLFASMGMELASSVPISVETVTIALITGVGVSAVAAALPARRAAKIPPIDAMSESVGGVEKPLKVRGWIGAVLVTGGVVSLVASVVSDGDGRGSMLGLGAVLLLVGALIISPVLMPRVVNALSWPFVRLGRPVVALARGNVQRNPRRASNTAGALMIGMALVGAAATLAASTQASVAGIIEDTVHSDFIVSGQAGPMPSGAGDAIAEVPGIDRMDLMIYGPSVVGSSTEFISGANPGFFDDVMTVTEVDGDLRALDRGEAVVAEATADAHGWAVGDSFVVRSIAPNPDGSFNEITLTVGGTFTSPALGVAILAPMDDVLEVLPEQNRMLDSVFLSVEGGADVEQVRADLEEAVAPYYVVSVMDKEEFTSMLTDQVNMMLNVLYALLALSIIIAVLGIVNTLALSVMERTREIGLQRAVGLSRWQLSLVTVTESVLIAVFGTVLGLAVGVGIATTLPSVFVDQGLEQLAIPYGQLIGMLVLAVAVGVLAALWPATRAARLPVLESIASD